MTLRAAMSVTVANDFKRVLMLISAGIAANSSFPAINYAGLPVFVLGCGAYAYFMFQRRYLVPLTPPTLEAGMAKNSLGKTESASLLEGPSPGPVCCIIS